MILFGTFLRQTERNDEDLYRTRRYMQEKIELQRNFENCWYAPKLQKSTNDLRNFDFVDKDEKIGKRKHFLEKFGKTLMARYLHNWVLIWKAKKRHEKLYERVIFN